MSYVSVTDTDRERATHVRSSGHVRIHTKNHLRASGPRAHTYIAHTVSIIF
jgi:hypothetical protein